MMAPAVRARFVVGGLTDASQAKDIVVSRVRLHQASHPGARIGQSVGAVLDDLTFVESGRLLGALKKQPGVAGLPDGQAATAVIDLLIKHCQGVIDVPS
jgi:hypothetical protein